MKKVNVMYQVTYQLGGAGNVHRSFAAAIQDLRQSRRAANRSDDCQSITIRKFDDLYSDHSNTLPLTDEECWQLQNL